MSAKTSRSQPLLHLVLETALYFVLGCPLLPCLAHAQATQKTPTELEGAIARVQAGSFSNADLVAVAQAGAARIALPALEQQFASATDVDRQGIVANALVRLGDKDNTYWNFLLQQATLAVDSDLPDPFHDSQGNATGRQLSPEFKAWAQVHSVDASTAIHSALFDLPGKVLLLAETGDPRGIPLLRRALQSHNYQIVAWAAKGLALIRDKESISLIIAAVQRVPSDYTSLVAESLVYFDDAQAQSAVDSYMPKDRAAIAREARADGAGPFGR
jgi:HEAT repeat protein